MTTTSNSLNMKKNFVWNLIGTTLNSFNSLFFMIVITRVNGVEDAGVFTLLFSIANLLYNIGIYAGRTYQVTDHSGKYSDMDYVVHRMLTTGAMFGIGALYCLMHSYDSYRFGLTMLLTVMKCVEAGVDALHGVLQKNDRLYQSGISYTIKAGLSLVMLIVLDALTHNLLVSFAVIDVMWINVMLAYDIPRTKPFLHGGFTWQNVMSLFPAGFFAFGFAFLNVYLSNATKYALDGLASSGEQAMYGIILMPATMLVLCALYLLQPYINRLAGFYAKNRVAEFRKSLRMIIGAMAVIGIAAELLAAFLGVPVLNIVYNMDLSAYLTGLLVIVAGATLVAIVMVLSTALTTFRQTRVQFAIYAVVSGIIFFLAPALVRAFGIPGAYYTYLISSLMQVCLYIIAYFRAVHTWTKETENKE